MKLLWASAKIPNQQEGVQSSTRYANIWLAQALLSEWHSWLDQICHYGPLLSFFFLWSFFRRINSLISLHQILVVACRIFICGVWALSSWGMCTLSSWGVWTLSSWGMCTLSSSGVWDLVPWLAIEPKPPALWALTLCHWAPEKSHDHCFHVRCIFTTSTELNFKDLAS